MGDLSKLIVAKGFKKLPKVQKIIQSGNTGCHNLVNLIVNVFPFCVLARRNFCVSHLISPFGFVPRLNCPTIEAMGAAQMSFQEVNIKRKVTA